MVGPRVTRWAPMVQAELAAQKVPLSDQLILQLIHVESRGKAGLINPKSGASGLMQVMPGTLQDFNKRHGRTYTMADLQGTSDTAARRQIEVGIGVLATYWRGAYRYLKKRLDTVPIDELAHTADLFYVAGPGATKKRLDKLSTPTWAAVQAAYPRWNALPHPRNVFKTPIESWDLAAIEKWLDGPIRQIIRDPKQGFAVGILILIVAYVLIKGRT
jgi:soluble lytic murein transglycosylase-like protein